MKYVRKRTIRWLEKPEEIRKAIFCPFCYGGNVTMFEFDDLWCRDCFRWFARNEFLIERKRLEVEDDAFIYGDEDYAESIRT